MRYPKPLTRGVQSEAAFPVEPVRARPEPIARPAFAFVELVDELQPAKSGRIDVRSEFGDVVFKLLDAGAALLGLGEVRGTEMGSFDVLKGGGFEHGGGPCSAFQNTVRKYSNYTSGTSNITCFSRDCDEWMLGNTEKSECWNLVARCATGYDVRVIQTFRHKGLRRFYESGSAAGIQAKHTKRLRMLLIALDTAQTIEDMDVPGFNLHPLKGKQKGRWSVWVNGNWRLTFEFREGHAHVLGYEDYH